MSAVLPAPLAASLKLVAEQPLPRELGLVTIGEIKRKLTTALIDVQVAGMHSRGNPEARNAIVAVYQPLKAALDVFEAAYKRGAL